MNIATLPRQPECAAGAFAPEEAPDLVIDWERFGRFVQAFRTKTGAGTLRLSQACGVHRAQIRKAEQFMPLSPNAFMRLCVFLQCEPTFFCKTLGGSQPHHPE